MSNELKMSDVFPKDYKLTFDYCPSYTGEEETYGFIFTSSEPCIAICEVVNNYDALTEHNRLLNLECDQLKADNERLTEVAAQKADRCDELYVALVSAKQSIWSIKTNAQLDSSESIEEASREARNELKKIDGLLAKIEKPVSKGISGDEYAKRLLSLILQ